MHIAISGYSGCGNTTVSRLLAKATGFELINFTFRNLAEEKGISFEQLRALAQTDSSYDIELDKRQVEMAMSATNSILASRLAIWMLKSADLKVFLDISAQERSRRVFAREGGNLKYWHKHTVDRDANDTQRYKKLYNIDNTDLSSGFKKDEVLVIKSDKATAEEIVDIILTRINFRSSR